MQLMNTNMIKNAKSIKLKLSVSVIKYVFGLNLSKLRAFKKEANIIKLHCNLRFSSKFKAKSMLKKSELTPIKLMLILLSTKQL